MFLRGVSEPTCRRRGANLDQLAFREVLLRIPADNRYLKDNVRMTTMLTASNSLPPAALPASCVESLV